MISRYRGRIWGNILRILFDALLFSILSFLFFLFSFFFFFFFHRLVPSEVCSIRFDIDNFRLASIFIFPIFIPFVSIRSNIPFVSIFQKKYFIHFIRFEKPFLLSISNKMKTGGQGIKFFCSYPIPVKTRRVNYYRSRGKLSYVRQ